MKKGCEFVIQRLDDWQDGTFIFFKNYDDNYSITIYFKNNYTRHDKNFNYIESNLKKFNDVFKFNEEHLKLFKGIKDIYLKHIFEYDSISENKINEARNKFINLMKTTIEKDELQKQINSNQTKTKRKRVI